MLESVKTTDQYFLDPSSNTNTRSSRINIDFSCVYNQDHQEDNFDCNLFSFYNNIRSRNSSITTKDFSAIVPINFKAITRYFFRFFQSSLEQTLKTHKINKSPSFEIFCAYNQSIKKDSLQVNSSYPDKGKLESVLNDYPRLKRAFNDLYISFIAARTSKNIKQSSKKLREDPNRHIIADKKHKTKLNAEKFSVLVTANTYSVLSGNHNYVYFVDWPNN